MGKKWGTRWVDIMAQCFHIQPDTLADVIITNTQGNAQLAIALVERWIGLGEEGGGARGEVTLLPVPLPLHRR